MRQSDFATPRYNSVTYGRHLLRHLGPKLWAKLSSDDRSAKTLNEFKRRSRGKYLAKLIERVQGLYPLLDIHYITILLLFFILILIF